MHTVSYVKGFLAAELLLCIRANTVLLLPSVFSIQPEKSRRWWRFNKKPLVGHLMLCSPANTPLSAQKLLYPHRHHWHNTGPCHPPAQESSCSPDKNTNFPSVKHRRSFSLMVKEVTMELDKTELSVPFSTWYHIQDHEIKILQFIPGRLCVSHAKLCHSYKLGGDWLPHYTNVTELCLLEMLTASQPFPLLQGGRSFICPKDRGVFIS